MRFFRGSKNKERAGDRANPDLFDWWAATFTNEERKLILTKFQPARFGAEIAASRDTLVRDDSLSLGKIINPDGSPAVKFSALAGWFSSPQHRHLARRILEKSEALSVGKVLDLHFTYSEMIPIYYRDRETDPTAFGAAVAACEKQIALGPQAAAAFRAEYPSADLPSHRGFTQLAIIREKERNYPEAIRLANNALDLLWAGDWKVRIARCQKRLAKL